MLRARMRVLAPLVILAAAATACGEPPDKEMHQAQGAIDAARAAGGAVYAAGEFTAAQDALKRAEDAVAARDYRLALGHALDSRERAQNAARLAADGKATAHVNAERAISDASAALATLQVRLKNPGAARLPARAVSGLRDAAADGERRVQEARTAVERGDYAAAIAAATAATTALTTATRDLDTPVSAPARRRR
jgi:hypothetical protein